MSNSLRGVNTLLLGPTGTGKTHSLRTLVEAGVTPFIIFTEPGYEILEDIPREKCHWKYIPPATVSWEKLLDGAKKTNQLNYDALSKLQGVNKGEYQQFLQVVMTLANFECDRDGANYGAVDEWDSSRALVIDGLSGLSQMAMDLVVGSKPTKSMPDWMISQDNLQRLMDKLTNDTRCHFVLIAHIEPEKDEVTGGVSLMASTLGRKLAPKLPRNFSDVILARREGENFFWSTADSRTDLKARNLPISNSNPPTFVPLLNTWSDRRKRGETPQESAQTETETAND